MKYQQECGCVQRCVKSPCRSPGYFDGASSMKYDEDTARDDQDQDSSDVGPLCHTAMALADLLDEFLDLIDQWARRAAGAGSLGLL